MINFRGEKMVNLYLLFKDLNKRILHCILTRMSGETKESIRMFEMNFISIKTRMSNSEKEKYKNEVENISKNIKLAIEIVYSDNPREYKFNK